jgi:Transposase
MDGEPAEPGVDVESAHTTGRMSARNQRIEVITRGERRRWWSVEQKREIAAESLEAGISPITVARRYGISSGLLYTWRCWAATAGLEPLLPQLPCRGPGGPCGGPGAPAGGARAGVAAPPPANIDAEADSRRPHGPQVGEARSGAVRRTSGPAWHRLARAGRTKPIPPRRLIACPPVCM